LKSQFQFKYLYTVIFFWIVK